MKQKVLGFDQAAALSFQNIDILDLAILAFMNEELRSGNNILYQFDGKTCISYDCSKIESELPILKLSRDAIRKRVRKMNNFGLVDVFTKNIENLGSRAFYTYGKTINSLGVRKLIGGWDENTKGLGQESHGVGIEIPRGWDEDTTPNIANNNYNNYNNQEQDNNNNAIKPLRAKGNWRKDYEVYKNIVNEAKVKILEDKTFEKEFLSMYPNGDFYRTIICNFDFWLSERGWEYKKKSRGEDINMVSTIKKNYAKNVIYKNPNDEPIENLKKLDIEVKEGKCADGTFIKGAYRYYHSLKDNKDYSIPIQAPPMLNERCEFDIKTNSWYIPRENEQIEDFFW